jgi:hypothetical protein
MPDKDEKGRIDWSIFAGLAIALGIAAACAWASWWFAWQCYLAPRATPGHSTSMPEFWYFWASATSGLAGVGALVAFLASLRYR